MFHGVLLPAHVCLDGCFRQRCHVLVRDLCLLVDVTDPLWIPLRLCLPLAQGKAEARFYPGVRDYSLRYVLLIRHLTAV